MVNDNMIEKSNILNTMKMLSEPDESIGLLEFRFFCLYLSKINARNPEQRTVLIKIEDFEELFGVSFHSTLFTKQLRKIASRQMRVLENGKYIVINLYSKFAWSLTNPKTLEITCNYDIMPYLFALQRSYTSYKIMNIVKLNSVQKIRLYEIMKQYEKIGHVKLDIIDLQEMICSKIQEFRFFKRDTLEPAIKDINQYTDIQISYEKKLSCRKVVALTFTIKKKELSLPVETVDNTIENQYDTPLQSLYYRCDGEYTIEQLEILVNYIENSGVKINISLDNYIYSAYANIKSKGNKVNNLFKYTLGVIKKQLDEHIYTPIEQNERREPLEPLQRRFDGSVVDDFKYLIRTTERRMSENKAIEEEPLEIKDDVQELPVINFKFFLEGAYVSFDCCRRLQALLELKYHKEDTFWLLEEPFTQEEIIELTLERHQVIVKPKQNERKKKNTYDDYDEILNSNFIF